MKKTYLDLSTGHLQQHTLDKLTQIDGKRQGWPAMTIATYREGVFVSVPDFNLVSSEQMRALPADLASMLLQAASEGAQLIRFDADGYVDGDLPYYQEI